MADTKISALTDGNPAVNSDELPIARGGFNYRVSADSIALLALQSTFEGSIIVHSASTAALPASTYANGAAGVGATLTKNAGNYGMVDGVSAVVGNFYLIKNQVAALQNGVYELTAANVFTRATDSDTNTELDGQVVIPSAGTVNRRFVFSQTTQLPTVGTSNIVYSQNPAVSVAPISITRDNARLAVLNSTLMPGRTYRITNAMAQVVGVTIDCQIYLVAETTNRLSTRGTGMFKNSVMGTQFQCAMDYYLSTAGSDDFISYLYEPIFGNALYFKNNYSSLDKMYLDTGNFNNITWKDAIATSLDDTTISNVTFEYNANVSITGTAVLQLATIGEGATIVMSGTQTLINGRLGAGKSLDLSGVDAAYSQNGWIYEGNVSTLIVTSTNSAAVNPDGSNIIDMTTFPWAGILITDDGTNDISTISGYNTDHKFDVVVSTSITVKWRNNGGTGTNISVSTLLTAAASTAMASEDVMEIDINHLNPALLNAVNVLIQ